MASKPDKFIVTDANYNYDVYGSGATAEDAVRSAMEDRDGEDANYNVFELVGQFKGEHTVKISPIVQRASKKVAKKAKK